MWMTNAVKKKHLSMSDKFINRLIEYVYITEFLKCADFDHDYYAYIYTYMNFINLDFYVFFLLYRKKKIF